MHRISYTRILVGPLVKNALNGRNSCLFTYGATGAGKSYTLFGADGERRGIIPRIGEDICSHRNKLLADASGDVELYASIYEIYQGGD